MRYYWLKLKRDFFKRHDIQIIESMPNGKDYILFYLKLLCESVDHEGNLRFNEQIPYSEQMLSTITNTNIDIVRSAIKVFTELQMMELLDNGTYFMNEVQRMIGSAVDNDNANRQRRYRERQKQLALQESYEDVTKNNESKSKSIELDIDTELNIKKEKKNKEKEKPSFNAEKAWEDTKAIYPRITSAVMAKQEWMNILVDTPERNRKDVAVLIYNAIKLYLSAYRKDNRQDEDYRYIPALHNWLAKECGYWIAEYERLQRGCNT